MFTNSAPTAANWWLFLFTEHIPTHSRSEHSFHAVVGCAPTIVHRLWEKYLCNTSSFIPLTVLWTLSFLHIYPINDIVAASLWGVSDTTFFDVVWPLLHFLYDNLNEVHWNDRLIQAPSAGPYNHCTFIIDTTECPIQSRLNALYSGYKKKHTFKYELAIAISTGKFVWAPTPGDGHYVGLPHCFNYDSETMTKRDKKIRSYIEHAIGRLKDVWNVLEVPWRHKYEYHYVVFGVCVHLTNMIFDEHPLFHIPHHSLWEDA